MKPVIREIRDGNYRHRRER